jgi:uncharacterized BrkB/YihY/UPF0761 family membrane protein
MIQVDKAFGAADRFQQRWPGLAFPVTVWKKFSDDQAGSLAALISHYAVAAIFPLLLVLGTVLNFVLRNNPALQVTLINSALTQYPVIGPEIKSQLGEISGSGLALAFGILFLVYGARGVAAAMQNAMCEVWGIPRDDRPGFPWVFGCNIALILTVGTGFIVTTFLSGLAGGAGHFLTGAGVVLGLMAWMYVRSEATLYAAEIDVVLVRRLWPRSLKSDTEQQPRVPGQRSGSGRVGSADDTKSSETKAA